MKKDKKINYKLQNELIINDLDSIYHHLIDAAKKALSFSSNDGIDNFALVKKINSTIKDKRIEKNSVLITYANSKETNLAEIIELYDKNIINSKINFFVKNGVLFDNFIKLFFEYHNKIVDLKKLKGKYYLKYITTRYKNYFNCFDLFFYYWNRFITYYIDLKNTQKSNDLYSETIILIYGVFGKINMIKFLEKNQKMLSKVKNKHIINQYIIQEKIMSSAKFNNLNQEIVINKFDKNEIFFKIIESEFFNKFLRTNNIWYSIRDLRNKIEHRLTSRIGSKEVIDYHDQINYNFYIIMALFAYFDFSVKNK